MSGLAEAGGEEVAQDGADLRQRVGLLCADGGFVDDADADVDEALAVYSATRGPRGADLVRRLRRAGRLYHSPLWLSRLAARASNVLPAAMLVRTLDPVLCWQNHPHLSTTRRRTRADEYARGTGRSHAHHGSSRRWWILAVLSCCLRVVVIDNTILNVAIPHLVSELGASSSDLRPIRQ